MSEELTPEHFREWLLRFARYIAENEAYLTELDAAIGDADHGTNMRRGMAKVRDQLTRATDGSSTTGTVGGDVGALLRMVAMTLINSVGGAAGPLYGAFFLRAATASGDASVNLARLATMFRRGLEGVQQRGKATLDEKTMLDAMQPAVEALEAASEAGATLAEALARAQEAAEAGMRRTTTLQATKGRASYLGSRSIGHQDPGATSTFYLFESAAETLGDHRADRKFDPQHGQSTVKLNERTPTGSKRNNG